MSKNIVVKSKRCEAGGGEGMACGPVEMTAIVAEMEILEENETKYLTVCWVDEASDAVSFEVTAKPILPYYIDLSKDQDELEEIRETMMESFTSYDGEYTGDYPEQYAELVAMVKERLIEEGYHDPEDYEDDEEEWEF